MQISKNQVHQLYFNLYSMTALFFLFQINTIAAIRHSATEGHTIVMSQTDSIHESFYDLFNHRFHRLDSSDGPQFYCNIAIGAHNKPCRIHPNFQCIILVNKNELQNLPPPFLNRFEKYLLSYGLLLDSALNQLPPFVSRIFYASEKKVSMSVANTTLVIVIQFEYGQRL